MIAYSRALSDAELRALHGELGQTYGIDIKAPVYWLFGDVLQEMRTGTGASPKSGYAFGAASTSMRDAAHGATRAAAGTGIEAAALVSLGGHAAVAFDGVNDYVSFKATGTRSDRTQTGGALTVVTDPIHDEYAFTLVANCQEGDGRLHRLLSTNATAQAFHLEVDGATGRVQFANTQLGAARGSGQREITSGVPFVVTLRGSVSQGASGTTDIFVQRSQSVLGFPDRGASPLATFRRHHRIMVQGAASRSYGPRAPDERRRGARPARSAG